MTSFNATPGIGSGQLNPPPGIRLDTPEQQEMYRAALEFERVFVQQMLKPMEQASKLFDDDEGNSSASVQGYSDMAQDQLTQSVLDGGGLGLASMLYGDMAAAAGILTPSRKDGA